MLENILKNNDLGLEPSVLEKITSLLEQNDAVSDNDFSKKLNELSLSLLGDQISDIYAKVLRIKKHQSRYMANIEFTSLTGPASTTIKKYVDEIIQIR